MSSLHQSLCHMDKAWVFLFYSQTGKVTLNLTIKNSVIGKTSTSSDLIYIPLSHQKTHLREQTVTLYVT